MCVMERRHMEATRGAGQTWLCPTSRRRPMQDAYWTHCRYGYRLICGVEVLEEYPNIMVLYAHTTCHAARRPMDPQATWEKLCDALQELDANRNDANARARAINLLDRLARWLRMGGVR